MNLGRAIAKSFTLLVTAMGTTLTVIFAWPAWLITMLIVIIGLNSVYEKKDTWVDKIKKFIK